MGMRLVLLAVMCALGLGAAPAASRSSSGSAQPLVHAADWPRARWPLPRNAGVELRIARLLARMSVEEKVGQVIQADISSVTPDEARRFHLGSILNGGNSGPGGDDFAPPAAWLALADAFYDASVDRRGGRAGIPIIWGTDAVHGHSNIIGATIFPHNIGLGATRHPALIEQIGAITAVEVRTTGMEWTFAPTVAVPQDYRWGRAYEGYSSDPALVSSYVGRMIRGLQGTPNAGAILQGPHVLASTKHFLGDGGTRDGRDQGDADISERTLRDIHGRPYVAAIDAGVGTIMTSFSSWQGAKIAGHHGLVTDVLKTRMGFDGFVVTDWNAHGQVAGCTNASCPQVLNAGVDMYMAPDSWRDLYASLLRQVKDGTVPMARLNDAVTRILRVKMHMGLFEAGRPSSRPLSGRFDLLGSADHRAVARRAVRESLVLLKNQDSLLPLRAGARVLVAGDAADNVARQSGGWTLTWQGTGVGPERFPGATTIWQGIREAVGRAGGSAELAPDGSYSTKPDVAIVLFGETPYAEFQGDLSTLQLQPELRRPFETMRRLKAAGVPVVAVMITGRPLFVNPALNAADAFVVAWLPGSEGGGVADMLFASRDAGGFTGRLPAAWPATARPGGATLFPFGYGLHGNERQVAWRPLSEDAGVPPEAQDGIYFDAGVPSPAWSLRVGERNGPSTRVTTLPASGALGRIRVSAVDHDRQEGARRFAFDGGTAQSMELVAPSAIDLSRQTNGDVMLLLTLRFDVRPVAPVRMTARCGDGCAGTVTVPLDAMPAPGTWRTLGLPLKCFARAGADMTRIDIPLSVETDRPLTFSLARVGVGTVADTRIACRDEPPAGS